MTSILKTAALVPFFCVGLASASSASVVTLAGSQPIGGVGSASGFSDFYNFTLSGSSDYAVTLSTSNISGLNVVLYGGTYTSGPLPSSSISTSTINFTTPAVGKIPAYTFIGQQASLGSGSYFFDVSGNSAGTYGGTFSVSAVPLPPALPLFGAALLMLATVGAVSYRSNKFKLA